MAAEDKAFRPRRDGWTPARQTLFLARLKETGCVADACRDAGLSTTSAYRTYKRDPHFADRWDMALSEPRPILHQAAFDRAVHGVEVEVWSGGKLVGCRRRYADGLLRDMIARDDRREAAGEEKAAGPGGRVVCKHVPIEEVERFLLDELERLNADARRAKRAKELAWAERMRKAGWAP